jgi:hypothetical protein
MITVVEVRNPQGELLTLTLGDSNVGILIEDIEGLEPVSASISSSTYANLPGVQYQSSRREQRDIVLKLELEPDYVTNQTVRDLRRILYRFFMPQSPVFLRFLLSDQPDVNIAGRVKDFGNPFFAKDAKVNIPIVCFDPDFLQVYDEGFSGSTTSGTTETAVDYEGTVDTGVIFTLNVNRSMSDLTLHNRLPDNTQQTFNFVAPMVSGDILTISSVAGAKSVMLTHAGVPDSILYGMELPSDWITLSLGTNYFRASASGAAVPYTVAYTPRYGGL